MGVVCGRSMRGFVSWGDLDSCGNRKNREKGAKGRGSGKG